MGRGSGCRGSRVRDIGDDVEFMVDVMTIMIIDGIAKVRFRVIGDLDVGDISSPWSIGARYVIVDGSSAIDSSSIDWSWSIGLTNHYPRLSRSSWNSC